MSSEDVWDDSPYSGSDDENDDDDIGALMMLIKQDGANTTRTAVHQHVLAAFKNWTKLSPDQRFDEKTLASRLVDGQPSFVYGFPGQLHSVDEIPFKSTISSSSEDDRDEDDDYELFPRVDSLKKPPMRQKHGETKIDVDQTLCQYVSRYCHVFSSRDAIAQAGGAHHKANSSSGSRRTTTMGDSSDEASSDFDDDENSSDSPRYESEDDSDAAGDEDGPWYPSPDYADDEYQFSDESDLDYDDYLGSSFARTGGVVAHSMTQKDFNEYIDLFNQLGRSGARIQATSLTCTFTNLTQSLSDRLCHFIFRDRIQHCYKPQLLGNATFLSQLLLHPIGFQAFADVCSHFPALFRHWMTTNTTALHTLTGAMILELNLPFQLHLVKAAIPLILLTDPTLSTLVKAPFPHPADHKATSEILHTFISLLALTSASVYGFLPDDFCTPSLIATDHEVGQLSQRNFLAENRFQLLQTLLLHTDFLPDSPPPPPTTVANRFNPNTPDIELLGAGTEWAVELDCHSHLPMRATPNQASTSPDIIKPKLHTNTIDTIFQSILHFADPKLALSEPPITDYSTMFPIHPMKTQRINQLCPTAKCPLLHRFLSSPLFHLLIYQLHHSVAPPNQPISFLSYPFSNNNNVNNNLNTNKDGKKDNNIKNQKMKVGMGNDR